VKIYEGTGNVFRDIGFSREEAESLRLRSDLMIALSDLIKKRRWTQAVAARAMGVTQPRVSDLKHGKLDRFSLDMLVQMLCRAGVDVQITLGGRKRRLSA
jgi:predicted XRE-type DNA-binding protein